MILCKNKQHFASLGMSCVVNTPMTLFSSLDSNYLHMYYFIFGKYTNSLKIQCDVYGYVSITYLNGLSCIVIGCSL